MADLITRAGAICNLSHQATSSDESGTSAALVPARSADIENR
ncbi:MAG TPA: hypothetical protein VKE94_06125 [Gemmataceae bacterium]|nr:hypothetical protein [Gemmataceae bacterium]